MLIAIRMDRTSDTHRSHVSTPKRRRCQRPKKDRTFFRSNREQRIRCSCCCCCFFSQGNIFACSLNYWFHVAAVCSPALGPAQLKSASLGPSLPKIAYQMLVIACNVLHVHRARWHRFIWSDYSTDYSAYEESLIQLNSARHCVMEIESIYTKPFAMPEYTSPIQCARKHHQSQAY